MPPRINGQMVYPAIDLAERDLCFEREGSLCIERCGADQNSQYGECEPDRISWCHLRVKISTALDGENGQAVESGYRIGLRP